MKAYTASDRNGDTGYSIMETIKPETNCSEFPNNSDTISRQAAIDVLGVFTQADALGHTPKQIVEALPSAQPVLTCDGCRHVGTYDTDFPCNGCVRREKDYYDPER